MKNKTYKRQCDTTLNNMIEIIHKTIVCFENETNSVALKDDLSFLENAKKKQTALFNYKEALEKFLKDQNNYNNLQSPIFKDFLELQSRLRKEILINMNFLEPLRKKVKVDKV